MSGNKIDFVETIISLIFVILGVFLINPFHFWMPTMVEMVVIGFLVACFGIMVLFILHEHPRDEREVQH